MTTYMKLSLFFGVLVLQVLLVLGTEQEAIRRDSQPIRFTRPTFCKEYQCPNFTVVRRNDDYEIRRYEPTTWVATENQSDWFAKWRMFIKLAKYTLRGYNNRNLRMSMTVPVLAKSRDSALVEMLFMIPEEYQEDPPLPTDSTVTIVKIPAMEVYVRSFGGYAIWLTYERELEALKSALGSSEPYQDDVMYRVGYDGPATLFNRHNEVWLLKG